MTTVQDGESVGDAAWDFWFALHKAAVVLEREADRLVKDQVGLSLPMFLVLSVIDAHPGPLNQTTIVGRLGLTKSTISRSVEAGARAGWIDVRPDPRSRRDRIATLTPQGTALVRRGDAALEGSALAVFPRESAESTRAATATLRQFVESVLLEPEGVRGRAPG